ncbi:uncharacterized protein K02A2.6-like [Dendronephthya gigantea]|uniref:uncharacterized protein K02A2.6-like n=1 Tax=Dendronephthya gigantea TaxID=151771 RepID=UPI00106DCA79|nr:uncharacterized protein K02A2.6-like [Dendronephthya gigantea]
MVGIAIIENREWVKIKLVTDAAKLVISEKILAVQQEETKPKEEKRHNINRHSQRKGTVNAVNPKEDDHDPVYAFIVGSTKPEKVEVSVGGCPLYMIIDSGASVNIVDRQTWEWLKKNRVVCTSTRSEKKLYTYASQEPLKIIGTFNCKVSVGHRTSDAEICVISGKGESLLGKDTAMKLGVLKMGMDIASVRSKPQNVEEIIQTKYPEVFKAVGKLKGRTVQLHINSEVKPVAQPVRRIPFSLRPKVEEKINELINLDIIEPVEGPTSWVNPVVIVPKRNGEIRLCVDMRRANEAIMRERHPIPTVDEITQGMNGSSVFSKLDLKWGYHQLELTPESRDITTFVTHCGLYRYKRLLFGVNSASEQYQHEIQRALAGLEGQVNISDDIIVYGQNQKEHDTRLENVVKRLRDFGLTLNVEKCQFSMDRLTFVGMVLSEKGISCTEEKVKAVVEAREPESASEVRSFLGLVNYCGRFIPDLATISEPLRCLTKKGSSWIRGGVDTDPERWSTSCKLRKSQPYWACEKFHQYVYGIQFELITDHKPLEVIYGPKSKPCARIERWVLRMQPYQFKVKYAPGSKNIADPLSRLINGRQTFSEYEEEVESYVRFVAVMATPSAMTTREVEEASADDEELATVRKSINDSSWDKMAYKQYIPCCDELCVIGQLVLRGTRVVIPKKLRPKVLSLAHEGHLGIVGTKQKLRSKVWWPGMEKDAEKYCKACHGCQLVSRPDFVEPIRTTTLPSGPWRDLAVDLLGPLPTGESILVIIDYYSRYYEVVIMRSTVTDKIIESLEEVFCRYGLPESITSDNGPQFISSEFKAYMDYQRIRHRRVTAKWPQANGEVERQNRSLLKRIQIAQVEKKDWRKEMYICPLIVVYPIPLRE